MLEITTSNFNQEVIQSEIPVLCDFWAPWCGPCRTIKPILNTISEEYVNKYKVVTVNIDQYSDLADKYNITAIPTILIFHKGEIKHHLLGLQKKQTLEDLLNALA